MDPLIDASNVIAELYKRHRASSPSDFSARNDFGVKEFVQNFIAQHGLAQVFAGPTKLPQFERRPST
eukprot:4221787-Ditylum_brightwellii.AAC.1